MAVTTIRNETPSRLVLKAADGQHFRLAPLQQRSVEDEGAFDLTNAVREGLISTWTETSGDVGEKVMAIVFGLGFVLAVACGIVTGLGPPEGFTEPEWRAWVWSAGGLVLILSVAVRVMLATGSLSLVIRFMVQLAALTIVLAVGVGVPAATIYVFSDGHKLLGSPSLALFGRLLQLSFIATASLLPVLLFFLFDRFQLGTLRQRLYRNLFRLDATVTTTGEIDAKYGSQIREAYGAGDQGKGRLAPGTRWPVLVCAFVITMGWIIALVPVGTTTKPTNPVELMALLVPQPTALVFGFLGAYFFTLRLIVIRYARGDLKPKVYSYIMVRIFVVAVLSWVLDATFPSDSKSMLILAFLFGITPDEFFTWIKESFRGKAIGKIADFSSKQPLTELEGIDLYDRARLENEGIVNIEGLAHHELIDLVLETRVPVPRLVDWVDQAILYLHLTGGNDKTGRATLRDHGIRTASDLLRTWNAAEARDELEDFKKLLGDEDKPYRLEVIRDALMDDEWMGAVCRWRENSTPGDIPVDARPTTFEGMLHWAEQKIARNEYKEAIRSLEEALNLRDHSQIRLHLANIFATCPVMQFRDPEQARIHAARAFELAPRNHAQLLVLIEVYTANGDYDLALQTCDAAEDVVSGFRRDKDRNKAKQKLDDLRKTVRESRERDNADGD